MLRWDQKRIPTFYDTYRLLKKACDTARAPLLTSTNRSVATSPPPMAPASALPWRYGYDGRTLFQNAEARSAEYVVPDDVAAELMTPFLVVHLDKVRSNVQKMLELAGGASRWRPHMKTTKLPVVWGELVKAGVHKFKVATTRECAVLCQVLQEAKPTAPPGDVLVAYPYTGPGLKRLGQIAQEYPNVKISVLCEDPTVVPQIPPQIGVFVDINPGMDRTGIPALGDPGAALAVAAAAQAKAGGAGFRGVHSYEGHLHQTVWHERTAAAHAIYDKVVALVGHIEAAGVPVGEVVTSGTPAFAHALTYKWAEALREGQAHTVSPGTVIFHDLTGELQNGECVDLLPAAVLMSRVVSRPEAGVVTLDAGSKGLAAEAGNPPAYVLGQSSWEALKCSEEHLPAKVPPPEAPPPRGTLVALVPRHICPTVNLQEEVVVVDGGDWARASIVPVVARGHELTPGNASCYTPFELGAQVLESSKPVPEKRSADEPDGKRQRTCKA